MKKRLSALILALIIGVLSVSLLTACNNSGNANSGAAPAAAASGDTPLYTIDGVEVTKAEVVMVGETPNLQIVFSNKTDKDIDVDFSQLSVKLSDGTVVGNLGLNRTIEANKTYSQHAITIEQKYGIKLGDKVEIYYGDDLIKASEVKEF